MTDHQRQRQRRDLIVCSSLWLLFVLLGIVVFALSSCTPQQQPLSTLPAPVAQASPVPIPPDPLAALSPDVRQAIMQNQLDTLQEGVTEVFPYSKNTQPSVTCSILHTTDIELNSDEQILKHGIDIGDSEAWKVKDNGVNGVFVKPTQPAIETNLVITTNKRHYHLLLKSTRGKQGYVTAISYYFPDDVRQQIAARNALIKAANQK